MIAEAINRILQLAGIQTVTVDGVTYSTTGLVEVKPQTDPLPATITVVSLTGLIELIDNTFEGEKFNFDECLLHVVNERTVHLISKESDEDANRTTLITASPVKTDGFNYGFFHGQEDFIIGVAAKFAETPDKQYVIDVASGLQAGSTMKAEDDGLAQKVNVQRGLSMVKTTVVKNRVALAPYRTFPEVAQPTSEFLFRLRDNGDKSLPSLALFEADGGAWKLAAMKSIAEYLAKNTKVPVIA